MNIKVVVSHALSQRVMFPSALACFFYSLDYYQKGFCSTLRSWSIQVCPSLLSRSPCDVCFPFCLPHSVLIFLSSNSICVLVLKSDGLLSSAVPVSSSGVAGVAVIFEQLTIGWPRNILFDWFSNLQLSAVFYSTVCFDMIQKSNISVHCVARTAGYHFT